MGQAGRRCGTGLPRYKAHPAEAIRRALPLCAARDIDVDADPRIAVTCTRYSSGSASPDHDDADAMVALCAAILHAEGATRPALDPTVAPRDAEGASDVPRPAPGHCPGT